MGLLNILAAPVTGPVSGLLSIARIIQQEAEREYHDIDKIRVRLAEIEARIQKGEIDPQQGDELAGHWLERLIEAQRYHSSRNT